MVEIGRFGCAVAMLITQASVFSMLVRFGAAALFTGIDADVEPVYRKRSNIVIGVNGSAFVALSSVFCVVSFGCTAGGGNKFAMFSFYLMWNSMVSWQCDVSPVNTRGRENSKKNITKKD